MKETFMKILLVANFICMVVCPLGAMHAISEDYNLLALLWVFCGLYNTATFFNTLDALKEKK